MQTKKKGKDSGRKGSALKRGGRRSLQGGSAATVLKVQEDCRRRLGKKNCASSSWEKIASV